MERTEINVITGEVSIIPVDPSELPPPPPPYVPPVVSSAQAQLALLDANLLDQVETMVNGADRATQIWYNKSNNWERNHPILNALAQSMGLTEEQVDNLFILAATK